MILASLEIPTGFLATGTKPVTAERRGPRFGPPSGLLTLCLLLFVPGLDVATGAGGPQPSSTGSRGALSSDRQSSEPSAPAAAPPKGADVPSPSGTNKSESGPAPVANLEAAAAAAAPESAPAAAAPTSQAEQERTSLNLLGQTDTDSGESRRNENVQFDLVNNNALKELNVRLGATATIVRRFQINQGYFGAEFGKKPTPAVHAGPRPGSGVHGNIFWDHNNSLFSARSFFQVGDVKPARENQYGGTVGLPLWKGGRLTLTGSQTKIRGNVNGNVLIPLPEERTVLATDPETAAIVRKFLDAYPNVAPNRPDIADRAHNANSLQSINTDVANVQLDQLFGDRDTLTMRYAFTGQGVDAFQLITGQNPDTDTKNHSARITWNRVWTSATITDFSSGFDRIGSLLVAAKGALGSVSAGMGITSLGPSPPIPIDRAINRFRYAGQMRHTRGRHLLTTGFAFTRLQYNGEESDGNRGILGFRNDFGRDAITNLRMGTPTFFIQALGSTYRGFRNWHASAYFGDRWSATQNLTLDMGLRYELFTKPFDVTGRSELPNRSDSNNWGPRFGFAYRLPRRWGVVRGAYGLLFGELFPVSFGQDRLNPPSSFKVVLQAPDLRTLREGLDPNKFDPNARSSWSEVSPDLSTPYSHHYNFSWEFELASDWRLQLGYVGSRSHKLFLTYFLNRGQPMDGIPLTSGTVNQRRLDPTRFESLLVHNGSRAYYDAGRVSLITPRWRGVTVNAAYWFSKALDLGGSYTNNASPRDARNAVAQYEFLSQPDLKGLSNFDQPHSFLLQFGYGTPRIGATPAWVQALLGSWNLSAITLLKTGTPFMVTSGADGPGIGNVDGNSRDRPIVVDPAVLGRTIGNPDTSTQLLPRSAFRFINAPAEMWGNLGRNTFRKANIANLNAGLSRDWSLGADWRMTFRAEAINLTNTPQFAEPGKELTSPNFGQINNTLNDGRTFRFLLRFAF